MIIWLLLMILGFVISPIAGALIVGLFVVCKTIPVLSRLIQRYQYKKEITKRAAL